MRVGIKSKLDDIWARKKPDKVLFIFHFYLVLSFNHTYSRCKTNKIKAFDQNIINPKHQAANEKKKNGYLGHSIEDKCAYFENNRFAKITLRKGPKWGANRCDGKMEENKTKRNV